MTRDAALSELTRRFDARVNGLALQHRALGNSPRIPGETAETLAEIAVQWAIEHGLRLE